jgi:hypothetical protein
LSSALRFVVECLRGTVIAQRRERRCFCSSGQGWAGAAVLHSCGSGPGSQHCNVHTGPMGGRYCADASTASNHGMHVWLCGAAVWCPGFGVLSARHAVLHGCMRTVWAEVSCCCHVGGCVAHCCALHEQPADSLCRVLSCCWGTRFLSGRPSVCWAGCLTCICG